MLSSFVLWPVLIGRHWLLIKHAERSVVAIRVKQIVYIVFNAVKSFDNVATIKTGNKSSPSFLITLSKDNPPICKLEGRQARLESV